MRLLTIETENIGAEGTRRLDLSGMPEGVIALVAANGKGKSTFLESSLPAAMFRTYPSRSPANPVELVAGRHGRIDVTYEDDGHTWRFLQVLDGQARKVDAHVYCDGVPYSDGDLTSTGRARVFDALIAAKWPPWQVVSASRYLAQRGVGSWQSADAPQRRAMLASLLGLDRLQLIADRAGAGERTVTRLLEGLDTTLAVLRQQATEGAEVAEQLTETRNTATAAGMEAERGAGRLEEVEREVNRAREAADSSRAVERLRERRGVEVELTGALGQADYQEANAAIAQAALVEAETAATGARRLAADAALAMARWRELDATRQRAQREVSELRAACVGEAPDVGALEAAHADATEGVQRLERTAAERKRVSGLIDAARQRLADLRSACAELDDVPCGGVDEYSECPLIENAVDAAGKAKREEFNLGELEAECSALPGVTAGQVEHARSVAQAAAHALAAGRKAKAAADTLDAAQRRLDAAVAALPARPESYDATEAERGLTEARTANTEATRQATEARAKACHLETRLAAMPSTAELEAIAEGSGWDGRPLAELVAERDTTRALVQQRRLDEATARERISGLETRAAVLADAATKADEAEARRLRLVADLGRVRRLRYGFGPRGIQGVLVESAGPAISDVANTLITKAYGWPRWRVDIRTRKDNLTGEGQQDVAECLVYDAERDAEGLLENVSGGELDMLASALAFGFAAHHGEVNDARWETLWLDEPTSAMTPDHRVLWLEMLRQAMPMLGVKQALLVDQSEEVQRAAEVVVRVEELGVNCDD